MKKNQFLWSVALAALLMGGSALAVTVQVQNTLALSGITVSAQGTQRTAGICNWPKVAQGVVTPSMTQSGSQVAFGMNPADFTDHSAPQLTIHVVAYSPSSVIGSFDVVVTGGYLGSFAYPYNAPIIRGTYQITNVHNLSGGLSISGKTVTITVGQSGAQILNAAFINTVGHCT